MSGGRQHWEGEVLWLRITKGLAVETTIEHQFLAIDDTETRGRGSMTSWRRKDAGSDRATLNPAASVIRFRRVFGWKRARLLVMQAAWTWGGRFAATVAAVLAVLAATACGGNGGETSGTQGSGGAGSGGGGTQATASSSSAGVTVGSGGGGGLGEVQTYSVQIGPLDVAPGVEQTMCVILDAGNASTGMLRRIRAELTQGSHHLIVTKIDDGGQQPVPTPCGAFAHSGDALFIAEKPVTELVYPNGTGLPFKAHQLVGLEMHYINPSSSNLQIAGTVEFDVSDGSEPLDEVRLMFIGDLSIYIPPQGSATVSSDFSVDAGAKVFALTSHTHHLGVHATIERSVNGSPVELLHESNNWAEPPFDVYQPALTFQSNEGLLLTCEYNNPTNQAVTFGTSANDEMCFLWAHYTLP